MTTVYIYDNPERDYVWQAIESVKNLGLPYTVITDKSREKSYAENLVEAINEGDNVVILEDDDVLIRKPMDMEYSYHAKPFIWVENYATKQAVTQAFENVMKPWHNVSSFYINQKDIPKLKEVLRKYNRSYGLDKVIQACLKVVHIDNPLFSFTAWRFHNNNISLIKDFRFYNENEKVLNSFISHC